MIRVDAPEDFRVDEIPLYAPTGAGGHTFVHVEKRGQSTEQVARLLARAAGVPAREVGYAGRKDRFAVTTQWFSVPGLAPERARDLAFEGVRVLAAAAHPHKLRTGQLRANRFEIALRELPEAALREARARLAALVENGLPNRFGGQRFGRDGDNAAAGARLLAGDERVRDRRQARFLLSALQAAVFNAVLAARGDDPGRLEPGDLAVVHASGGIFRVDDLTREVPRARAFEISPTGPIFGTRMRWPEGGPAEREREALRAHGVDIEGLRPPRGIRLRGARRPLRVRPEQVSLGTDGGALRIGFTLPAGSYASVLLEELLGPAADSLPAPGVS